jgi:hypothetical protein
VEETMKKNGNKGNGIGAHHHVSPMGHATRTKTRKGKQRQLDRKLKQKGWE